MAWFNKKNKPREEANAAQEIKQPLPDEEELIAVLSAAVAAMAGEDASGFILRSYKRVGPSAWKKSGRDYQLFH